MIKILNEEMLRQLLQKGSSNVKIITPEEFLQSLENLETEKTKEFTYNNNGINSKEFSELRQVPCDYCYACDNIEKEYEKYQIVNEFSFGDLLKILLLFSDMPSDMESDIYNMSELEVVEFARNIPSKNFQEKNDKLTDIVANILDMKREAGLL